MKHTILISITAAVTAATLFVAAPSPAVASSSLSPIGVVGCSNTRNAVTGYHDVSSANAFWSAASIASYGGGSVVQWEKASDPRWATFDEQLAARGAAAVWLQLCVADSFNGPLTVADNIVALIRQRTNVPIYASAIDDTPSCNRSNPALSQDMVDHLVANGSAERGPVMQPLTASQTLDGCHANDVGDDVWGETLALFFTGIGEGDDPSPTPNPSPNPSSGSGLFIDDDNSPHETNIEWIAKAGITLGCNPPANDRYCPDDSITRGQMATFLVRALDLPPARGAVGFIDDDGIHEGNIEAVAAAGIAFGCNPPSNDRFCPYDPVTRAQMASFLARAFDLPHVSNGPTFIDDDGSVHEANIEAIAAAGITVGCNPPKGDRFCPDDPVTRAQMATFLVRALTQ